MKKTLLFIALLCTGTYLLSQNNINGIITDTQHKILTGATIYIPELQKGTISDSEGKYELKNLPNGHHKLQVSYMGYKSQIIDFQLNGNVLLLDAKLEQSPILGDEIVISGGYNATQHENAVKIDVLKLNQHGILPNPDFSKMLRKIPGVDVISKGNGVSKPVIRGLSMNDILVLNNGVRFENYQYSSHHPLGIDEFGIEEIEVIKGPSSLLYGSDAIGGIINFIKERPAPIGKISGDINTQFYSNNLGFVNNAGVKGSSEKLSGGLRIGHKSNSDFLQGGGDYAPNSRFNEYSIKSNAGFTGKKGSFKIYYDYNNQKLGLVEEEAIELIDKRARANEIYYQEFDTHLLSAQNKIYLGKFKIDINSSLQNTELIHYAEKNVTELQMDLTTLIYESKVYLPSDARSEYIIGIQGINQVNHNKDRNHTILLPDAGINNYSVFTLVQKTLFDPLKVQFGARYDIKEIKSQSVGIESLPGYREAVDKKYGSFSGSVGAVYSFSEDALIRSNFAAAYRTPNLAELTSDGQHETRYEKGNPNLAPENSYEWDISLHIHKNNFTLDLAGFYNIISNYIFIAPTDDTVNNGLRIYRYMQGNSILFGGEAGFHLHPEPIDWFHFEADFSYVLGKQENGDFLPFIPANKLCFEIMAESDRLLFLNSTFFVIRSTTAFDQIRPARDEYPTDGYSLIDMGFGGKINLGKQLLSFIIGVDNLFDTRYTDHLSTLKEVNLYNPGRNVSLTLKLPFGFEKKE